MSHDRLVMLGATVVTLVTWWSMIRPKRSDLPVIAVLVGLFLALTTVVWLIHTL